MMNRIKHFALFALLLVPAIAQASAVADVKSNSEKYYNYTTGRCESLNKAQASQDFADLANARKRFTEISAIRNPQHAQPTSKKKNDSVNPVYAWYKNNKTLVGAVVGGIGFGAAAFATNPNDANTNCVIGALGAITGAAASSGNRLAYSAAGALGGGLTGYLHSGSQGRPGEGIWMGALIGGYFTGIDSARPHYASGAVLGGLAAGTVAAVAHGSVYCPFTYPVLLGAMVGGRISEYNAEERAHQKERERRRARRERDHHHECEHHAASEAQSSPARGVVPDSAQDSRSSVRLSDVVKF